MVGTADTVPFRKVSPIQSTYLCAAGLRKKSVVPGSSSFEQKLRQAAGAPELFGQSDVVVKHVLEVSGVRVRVCVCVIRTYVGVLVNVEE